MEKTGRDKAILVLRRYMSGKISNDELEKEWPKANKELAEIFKHGVWHIYSDLERHFNTGRHKLSKDGKTEVARWILFLQSDQTYTWPTTNWRDNWPFLIVALLVGLIGLRWGGGWATISILPGIFVAVFITRLTSGKTFRRRGDWEVWPFRTRADFEEAKRHPKYLTGVSQRNTT